MRLVASTASAFFAATAASMFSRVSSALGGITSQLTKASVVALLILDARTRSNEHRWLKSGLIPTIKTRENDWSRETLSDHSPVTDAWLGAAASHPPLSSNRADRKDGRAVRG